MQIEEGLAARWQHAAADAPPRLQVQHARMTF